MPSEIPAVSVSLPAPRRETSPNCGCPAHMCSFPGPFLYSRPSELMGKKNIKSKFWNSHKVSAFHFSTHKCVHAHWGERTASSGYFPGINAEGRDTRTKAETTEQFEEKVGRTPGDGPSMSLLLCDWNTASKDSEYKQGKVRRFLGIRSESRHTCFHFLVSYQTQQKKLGFIVHNIWYII